MDSNISIQENNSENIEDLSLKSDSNSNKKIISRKKAVTRNKPQKNNARNLRESKRIREQFRVKSVNMAYKNLNIELGMFVPEGDENSKNITTIKVAKHQTLSSCINHINNLISELNEISPESNTSTDLPSPLPSSISFNEPVNDPISSYHSQSPSEVHSSISGESISQSPPCLPSQGLSQDYNPYPYFYNMNPDFYVPTFDYPGINSVYNDYYLNSSSSVFEHSSSDANSYINSSNNIGHSNSSHSLIQELSNSLENKLNSSYGETTNYSPKHSAITSISWTESPNWNDLLNHL